METHLSQVPVFKSTTRILVKVDRNRIKECVIQLITMEEIMSKKTLDGYLVPVVELAKFYTVDATAMKRKLKRKGFKIDKAIVMYNGSERSLNVMSAVDARVFINEPDTDSKLLCVDDLDTLLD
jgi:hypothetical protein